MISQQALKPKRALQGHRNSEISMFLLQLPTFPTRQVKRGLNESTEAM